MPRDFRIFIALLFCISLTTGSLAQHPNNQQSDAGKIPQSTAELPLPSTSRTESGAPAPDYWQQRADYHIQVQLDPSQHVVAGIETIVYTNNSPDSLHQLWLQLDQNLFRQNSRGALSSGGFDIRLIEILHDGEWMVPEYSIEDTRMQIMLNEPMMPRGSRLEIKIDFAFTVPDRGAGRMGRLDVEQGRVYQIAQWYPRMYVYDDMQGWNNLPYRGQGEFYLEYGDFEVEITVPKDYIVVATGELQNEEEVLTREQRDRLDKARQSNETIAIITPEEVGSLSSRPTATGPLTWTFRANNVRDFAWAASQAFIWDAAAWNDVLIMSAYPREGVGQGPDSSNPGWEMSTQYARHSIQYYSETWFPYPYPVAINVAGTVGGMEYPMIVFCSVRARGRSLFGVTDHEFGHMWYPMIVGSDERNYAWMDEGVTTFINYYSAQDYYEHEAAIDGGMRMSAISGNMVAPDMDHPIMTPADQIPRGRLGFLAYRKPAIGLVILREKILGPEVFDRALREYTRRWAFKHPQPADFFRTFEDMSGQNLDWFWNGWFFSSERLDQAVEAVIQKEGATQIQLSNRGGLILPFEIELTFSDGSTDLRTIPVVVLESDDPIELVTGPNLVEITIDPDQDLPDIDRSNNFWRAVSEAPDSSPFNNNQHRSN